MTDNISMHEFNIFSTMDEILQGLHELPSTYIFVIIVANSFDLLIIFLKKWFGNGVKNVKPLERIQTLAERIYTTENKDFNLTGKIQSMTMHYESFLKVLRD